MATDPYQAQTTRIYSPDCSPTTPPLPRNHQILFTKLLSRHCPRPPPLPPPPGSFRHIALPPRLNDLQTTRFHSQNCSPTMPPRPPQYQNLFAHLLSRYAPMTSQPADSIRNTALPPWLNDIQKPDSIRPTALPPRLHYLPITNIYSQNCSPATAQRPPNH